MPEPTFMTEPEMLVADVQTPALIREIAARCAKAAEIAQRYCEHKTTEVREELEGASLRVARTRDLQRPALATCIVAEAVGSLWPIYLPVLKSIAARQ